MKMILSQFRLPAENYVRTFETFQPLTSLYHHYPDVFWKDLGAQPATVHLSVNENAEPSVTPSRRIPLVVREKFKGELDRFQKVRVWAKVDEPTAWVSSVGTATKRSGSLRICINPRPLNQAVKREAHLLPILDNLMPEMAWANIFLTVDLTAGYWHCAWRESSLLTTFATPFRIYRWKIKDFHLVFQHQARSFGG